MSYEIRFTTRFKKDVKQISKQGKKLDKLYNIVQKLADKIPLEQKYRDHELRGDYEGFRECHIEPDWLLIYQTDDCGIILLLTRTGSHSDLF